MYNGVKIFNGLTKSKSMVGTCKPIFWWIMFSGLTMIRRGAAFFKISLLPFGVLTGQCLYFYDCVVLPWKLYRFVGSYRHDYAMTMLLHTTNRLMSVGGVVGF